MKEMVTYVNLLLGMKISYSFNEHIWNSYTCQKYSTKWGYGILVVMVVESHKSIDI